MIILIMTLVAERGRKKVRETGNGKALNINNKMK
jgi:hypothetical protein